MSVSIPSNDDLDITFAEETGQAPSSAARKVGIVADLLRAEGGGLKGILLSRFAGRVRDSVRAGVRNGEGRALASALDALQDDLTNGSGPRPASGLALALAAALIGALSFRGMPEGDAIRLLAGEFRSLGLTIPGLPGAGERPVQRLQAWKQRIAEGGIDAQLRLAYRHAMGLALKG